VQSSTPQTLAKTLQETSRLDRVVVTAMVDETDSTFYEGSFWLEYYKRLHRNTSTSALLLCVGMVICWRCSRFCSNIGG